MSSHLPYSSSYVSRTTNKFGAPSSYSRTTSAPSSNTSSLDRSVRGGSYVSPAPPTSSRSSSLSRYGSAAGRGYSVEAADRGKTPPPPAAERRPLTSGLRMGSTSRFGAPGIARSPLSEKSPTVFGVAPREEDKLQLVSRATSPTPPSTSAFLREKRATQDKTLTDWVPRPGFRPVCISAETQTDEDLKADSPPPPAVVENPRVASRWGNRIAAPRYSSTGGYSLSRKEPQVTSRYGGLGFKPEAETSTAKQPEPPKPQPPPRSDSLATVNKDFRKSVLNMDLSSQEQNKPPSLPSMKSRSNLNLTLNKSKTTNSLNQANGKQTKKDSSSSEESSTSEEESSSDESDCHRMKPPDPNRNSNNDITLNKPPASPKSVLVKTVTAAALMKVQMPQEPSVDENKKPYSLRKFDSGVREWWLESNKDIPSSLEVQNKINQNIQQQPESNIPKLNDSKGYTLRKFDSGEKSWWSESSSDAPLVEKKQTLLRAPSKTKLSASSPSNSETETKNNLKLKNSSSKLNIPKCGSVKSSDSDSKVLNNLYKSPSRTELSSESESKSLGIGKLYESGLSRTSSGISLGGKTPVVVESVRRSTVLDPPTEYTPGLLRLHGSYRPLRRVESGQRDWWLDEADEETAVDNKSPGRTEAVGGWVGPFQDIDHVLGNLAPPPAAFISPTTSDDDSDSSDDSWYKKVMAKQNGTGEKKVDDSTLQLYKDGDFGSYLDLDASINEQQEEFSNFTNNNRKNSIVLRTQLSVRVHAIIEKLLKSEGRELQRALFALKQIFKEDKDLVHEFVQNEGLSTLIKVGHDSDQNYQNYILRALGQVMLYVDGMNGVINHPGTVQWLYDLVASRFRLLVKTALKLLLVFVEYSESNCVLLVKAIRAVDYVRRTKPWHNIMKLIKECQAGDTELLIYAMSLINKTLGGLPDQDMYYDQVDPLEEQGIEAVIRGYMSKQGVDLDLLRQFQIYEAVLRHEDGDDEKGSPLKQLDEAIRKSLLNRKNTCGTPGGGGGGLERRKSRRYSTGNSPLSLTLSPRLLAVPTSPSQQYSLSDQSLNINGSGGGGGCETPTERRERRRERQRSFLRQQREVALRAQLSSSSSEEAAPPPLPAATSAPPPALTVTPAPLPSDRRSPSPLRIPPVSPASTPGLENGERNYENGEDEKMCQYGLVRDLSQKLANALHSPTDESKYPFSDMKGIISKAKEELAKSASRGDGVKSPTRSSPAAAPTLTEVKKTETELHWEEMARDCQRPLRLADLDFTDLASDEEPDLLCPAGSTVGVVPPPPPPATPAPPPPAAPSPAAPPPPASANSLLQVNNRKNSTPKKTKKTVKLFWKEVREDPIVLNKLSPGHLLWDELSPVVIDTQKLEHLFESRAKDLITKKQQEMNKNKEIIVLDHKRSNAINIGMTKLPPPRSIKTAILKMDATVMNREGIEKLLTMLPTEEERTKIQEAQTSNPDLPLGSAEQFLLTLASISELPARLKLWAFKLDYENSEKETAERLMDLKQGMETLRVNKTFRAILGTLLSIGIFLNGSEVKGFQIEYLAKVPEVKDTVHKHTLLHHLCHMVMEKFPDATDLYSEIGAVTRASKVDFDELASNLQKMEQECKASFDHLKVISKHDGASNIKLKMSDFLADSAERIIVLTKVHRRVLHRFQKFCLWLGFPLHRASLTKPNELCQVISEFALEYRTTRERVLQQLEKKANHKERTKTRGKMITEVGKFRSQEDRADAELKELLDKSTPKKLSEDSSTTLHGSLPWRRIRKSVEPGLTPDSSPLTLNGSLGGGLSDCDDEILESLVKTATRTPTARHLQPRDRKRTRNAERKSLRRTLRSGLTEEDQKHLAAYIKGY